MNSLDWIREREDEIAREAAIRVAGRIDHGLDNPVDASKAQRAPGRIPPRRRIVVDGRSTFSAVSAEELLEYDSLGNYGRPGQPY